MGAFSNREIPNMTPFFPYMLFPGIAALLAFMLGLGDLPTAPTDEQVAAAEIRLARMCVSCPVYEIVDPALAAKHP